MPIKIVEGYQKKVEEVFRLIALIKAHGDEPEIELDDIMATNIEKTLLELQKWVGENIGDDEPNDETEADGKT